MGPAGTLGGNGTIGGNVVNAGTLAPGNSIGLLTVNGSYTQMPGSTYQVEVNNAGQGLTRSVLDLTDEDVDLMMSVNVKSALYGMQAIAPAMMERGSGHIINISSFLARVPLAAYRSAYSAAKAALNSLTANLRMDLALSHPKITVSVVMPGLVSTAFSQNAVGGPPQRLTDGVPSQTPQEVAAAIAELIEKPRAELITNPALAAVGQRYVLDVEAFEAKMRTGAR